MSILIDEDTRVVVQGITGREGSFHAEQMINYGTAVTAGVTPGRAGQKVKGVPVYNTVSKAVKERGCTASVIFVPAAAALDAVYEAGDAGIRLIVCITEGMPAHEALLAYEYAKRTGIRLIGPNCPGIICPGRSKIGIMPTGIHKKGNIGIVSRSGTLTYEIVASLTEAGYGQSACVGIGGDAVQGSGFTDIMSLMNADPETKLIVMVGELGGRSEEQAAKYAAENIKIPVIAFIAGVSAPRGKKMGHAGAIASGEDDSAESKKRRLREMEMEVADFPGDIAALIRDKYGSFEKSEKSKLLYEYL